MIYFLSMLGGEYIKIGYTGQCIEKRISALQTGNPCEIEIVFTIDGTLKQEKEIHRNLKEVFGRLKVFSNPVNEWYPLNNPIIKAFMNNVKNMGISYAMQSVQSLLRWGVDVKEEEICSIRHLERILRNKGFSRKQAKVMISQKKHELMNCCFATA